MGEGIVREFGTDMDTLLYLKRMASKDLLYSAGNCSTFRGSLDGRGRMEWILACVCLSPFAVHLKLSRHC